MVASGYFNSSLWKMAQIVSFLMDSMMICHSYVELPEGNLTIFDVLWHCFCCIPKTMRLIGVNEVNILPFFSSSHTF